MCVGGRGCIQTNAKQKTYFKTHWFQRIGMCVPFFGGGRGDEVLDIIVVLKGGVVFVRCVANANSVFGGIVFRGACSTHTHTLSTTSAITICFFPLFPFSPSKFEKKKTNLLDIKFFPQDETNTKLPKNKIIIIARSKKKKAGAIVGYTQKPHLVMKRTHCKCLWKLYMLEFKVRLSKKHQLQRDNFSSPLPLGKQK